MHLCCPQTCFNAYMFVCADWCTWKNKRLRLYICKTYYHPCSHSGKVISIFALLLNLWTPVCLMCSELQHRCHSLSYAGRHLTGCSQNTEKKNTMCTTSKISVCSTWRRKDPKLEKTLKWPPSLFTSLHFLVHLGTEPFEISHSDWAHCFIKDTRHATYFPILGQPEIWKSDFITLMIWVVWSCRYFWCGLLHTKQNECALVH